jgi:hypothetical protein
VVTVLLAAGARSTGGTPTPAGRRCTRRCPGSRTATTPPRSSRALLSAGADVDATTHDGASPLDICRVAAARRRAGAAGQAPGHDGLADLLVAAGATH